MKNPWEYLVWETTTDSEGFRQVVGRIQFFVSGREKYSSLNWNDPRDGLTLSRSLQVQLADILEDWTLRLRASSENA